MKGTFEADFTELKDEVDSSIAKLRAFEGESAKAGPAVTSSVERMTTSFRAFDNTLNAVGVHAGQTLRAIEEVAGAAGKTASELGAIATAGLAIGTFFAAKDATRGILEFLGIADSLDKTVAGLTTRLFGLNDVQKEVAAAQQDTVNKAISEGAAKTITYAEAVKYLTDKQNEQRAAQKAYEDGIKALTLVGQNWHEVLKGIAPATAEQARRYLELGASTKDVAGAFRLTETQVRALVEANKDLAAAEKEVLAIEGQRRVHAAGPADLLGIGQKVPQEFFGDMLKGLEDVKRANAELQDFIAKNALSSTDYQIKQINDWADASKAAFKGDLVERQQYYLAVDALANEQVERLKQKEREIAAAAAEAARLAMNELIGIIPDIGHGAETPTPWSTLTPKAIGVKPIGVAYAPGAAGPTVNMNVSGVWDPASIRAIVDAVSEELMRRSGRKPGSA